MVRKSRRSKRPDYPRGWKGQPYPAPGTELERCYLWLESLLERGPLPPDVVKSKALEAGFSLRTLRRAKEEVLMIPRGREGFGAEGRYLWELPKRGPGLAPIGGQPRRRPKLDQPLEESPFTFLPGSRKCWEARRAAWLRLGLRPPLGRGEVFDPVLCECIFRWFTAPGWSILDPFSRGSAAGIVAARLGRTYTGIETRADDVAHNYAQYKKLANRPAFRTSSSPRWALDLECESLSDQPAEDYDFLFTRIPIDPPPDKRLDGALCRQAWERARAEPRLRQAIARLRSDRSAYVVCPDPNSSLFLRRLFEDENGFGFYNDIAWEPYATTHLPAATHVPGLNRFRDRRILPNTFERVLGFLNGDPNRQPQLPLDPLIGPFYYRYQRKAR